MQGRGALSEHGKALGGDAKASHRGAEFLTQIGRHGNFGRGKARSGKGGFQVGKAVFVTA